MGVAGEFVEVGGAAVLETATLWWLGNGGSTCTSYTVACGGGGRGGGGYYLVGLRVLLSWSTLFDFCKSSKSRQVGKIWCFAFFLRSEKKGACEAYERGE